MIADLLPLLGFAAILTIARNLYEAYADQRAAVSQASGARREGAGVNKGRGPGRQ
jgi:hypothetical protein